MAKNALMKRRQKVWVGPSPPSFGQNPKEQQVFLGKPSLTLAKALNFWVCYTIENCFFTQNQMPNHNLKHFDRSECRCLCLQFNTRPSDGWVTWARGRKTTRAESDKTGFLTNSPDLPSPKKSDQEPLPISRSAFLGFKIYFDLLWSDIYCWGSCFQPTKNNL